MIQTYTPEECQPVYPNRDEMPLPGLAPDEKPVFKGFEEVLRILEEDMPRLARTHAPDLLPGIMEKIQNMGR